MDVLRPKGMRTLAALLVLLLFGRCRSGQTDAAKADPAQEGGATAQTELFYPDSKPLTRWWWFAEPLAEADIRAQLIWISDHGFGGVEIAWVYPLDSAGKAVPPEGTPAFLGPEWQRAVASAARIADSLDLQSDWTFGSLWPFGGPFVAAADATKDLGDTATGQFIRLSWDHPRRGRVLNHLDRDALKRYADTLFAALRPAMHRPNGPLDDGQTAGIQRRRGLFCDSWEVHAGSLWSAGLDTAFYRHYGYRLEDTLVYLAQGGSASALRAPVPAEASPERAKRLFEALYEPAHAGILYDYRKLIAGRAVAEFYGPWTERAQHESSFTRAQAAGSPTDLLRAYAAVDVPESEALLFEPNFSRIPASAAAWSGKAEVSAEAFTCIYGWDRWPGPGPHHTEEQVADLRLLADALFANGVNQMIWHGTPYQKGYGAADSTARAAWDPRIFFATVHAAPGGALESELTDFNAYLTAVSDLMKRGRPAGRVGVLLPLEDAWRTGAYGEPEQAHPGSWGAFELRYVRTPEALRGYQPLWISGHFLEKALNDALPVPLQALVLDQAFLDAETLYALLALAREGLPMALLQTPKAPGAHQSPGYADSLAALLELPGVVQHLESLVLPPRLVEGRGNAAIPPFWAREEPDRITLFFPHPMARNLTYPMPYGLGLQAAEMDSTERVVVHAFGRHEMELHFTGGASKLLVFTPDGNTEYRMPGFAEADSLRRKADAPKGRKHGW